jgi:hypothetical protein
MIGSKLGAVAAAAASLLAQASAADVPNIVIKVNHINNSWLLEWRYAYTPPGLQVFLREQWHTIVSSATSHKLA